MKTCGAIVARLALMPGHTAMYAPLETISGIESAADSPFTPILNLLVEMCNIPCLMLSGGLARAVRSVGSYVMLPAMTSVICNSVRIAKAHT